METLNKTPTDKVGIALDTLLKKLDDQAFEIQEIVEKEKSVMERDRKVKILLAKHVVKHVTGYMKVKDFSTRKDAVQFVHLFVGSHWEVIEWQQFQDFVKEAMQIMAVPEIFAGHLAFLIALMSQICSDISHFHITNRPHGDIWVNMKNGTLEIHRDASTTFREHRAEDFMTYCLDYGYDPAARCPLWHKFLDEVLPEKAAQQLLMEYIGYCFTTDLKLEKMAVLYGDGCNGKSVCTDVISALLGRNNITYIDIALLSRDAKRRVDIEDKLANISSETRGDLEEATIKKLVSGEPVDGYVMYHGYHTIYNYGKFFTNANKLPEAEDSYAYFRRWILFPFKKKITEDKKDVNLTKKLTTELPGIMNWVLASLQRVVKKKQFTESDVCNKEKQEYMIGVDSVKFFMEEEYVKTDTIGMNLAALHSEYQTFCYNERIQEILGRKAFKMAMIKNGYTMTMYRNVVYFNVIRKSRT